MIPVSGMSSILALRITDRVQEREIELLRETPQHARAIDAFRERIADVETVDQLIDDYELYTFVMRAYDLEDQIFGKAMIKAVLKSNIEDDEALVNKLTDVRFKELYEGLGFGVDGVGNINTILKSWQNKMVEKYLDRQFVNAMAEQNDTLGSALEFRRRAADIEGPFDILKNVDTAKFMRKALGLPDEIVQIDIDRQAKILEEYYDLEKLKDPAEVERLISRYVIISDATDDSKVSENAIVQLMTGAVNAGSSGFVPIILDITGISAIKGGY